MKRLAEAVRAASARRRRGRKRGAAAAGLREYLQGYDEGTFDPSKYAMDARVTNGATREPPPPPRREERDETPRMRRRETIEPPPGREGVGFEAAIWRERARQKAAERAAERGRRGGRRGGRVTGAVAVQALNPRRSRPSSTRVGLNPPARIRLPAAVAPKRSSARKAPRSPASIAGTPGLGTVKTAKTVERFGAFQSSPYAPSKSAAKEIASLARNLRF